MRTVVAGSVLPSQPIAIDENDAAQAPPIIDAHVHLWSLARGDYGWLDDDVPATLKRDFAISDIAPLLAAHGVAQIILVQAAPTLAETRFLLSIAAETPIVAGVVGWLDFEAAAFAATLRDMAAQSGFVGVRPILHDLADPAWILRAPVIAALHGLVEADMPIDIACRPDQLGYVAQALSKVPGLRAVIDHLGSPPIADGNLKAWADALAALAAFPSVNCKVSGLGTLAQPGWQADDLAPAITHARALFGVERVIWGSDWPVSLLGGTYGSTLDAPRMILERTVTPAAFGAIFGGNAARFYRIDQGAAHE